MQALIWFLLVFGLIIVQTGLAMFALWLFIQWCARNAPPDPYDFDEFEQNDYRV